jgi:hypothetical protein
VEYWRKEFSATIPGLNIIDFQSDDHADSVIMSFMITGDQVIQQAGDFFILHPDIFREAKPSELKDEERQQPIWFGKAQEVETHITWSLPDLWKTSEDTFKLEGACTGADLVLETHCSPGRLDCHSRYRQRGKLMKSGENREAVEFSRKLSQLESHAILFTLSEEGIK